MFDRRLAQRIANGDRAAGERWALREYPGIYRMLTALSGEREVGADLTQQAFMHAWGALAEFRGGSSLRTWLRRIAYHEYTHWLRDRKADLPLADAASVPDLRHAADLDTIAVGQALCALPEELRTPFLCFYMQGMPLREIAALTEAPLGTVKSRLFTARARLREMLAPPPAAGERALASEQPQEG